MSEHDGRFLCPSPGAGLQITDEGLFCHQTTIVAKRNGRFLPSRELPTRELRAKAERIATLLTEGKNAEAVFLANFSDWRVPSRTKETHFLSKSGYNPSESRDGRGRWSSTGSQASDTMIRPRAIPIASADDPRGNQMARDAATAAGLNRAQRRRLHDLITGQGITDYQEILRIAKEIASGGA